SLYHAAAGMNYADGDSVDALKMRLREAMLAWPAEPYFAKLGAEISLRTGNADVLRWISRALERGESDPMTHILAARALHRYGALNQALLELRLAAELSTSVAPLAGKLAAGWSKSLDDVLRA